MCLPNTLAPPRETTWAKYLWLPQVPLQEARNKPMGTRLVQACISDSKFFWHVSLLAYTIEWRSYPYMIVSVSPREYHGCFLLKFIMLLDLLKLLPFLSGLQLLRHLRNQDGDVNGQEVSVTQKKIFQLLHQVVFAVHSTVWLIN